MQEKSQKKQLNVFFHFKLWEIEQYGNEKVRTFETVKELPELSCWENNGKNDNIKQSNINRKIFSSTDHNN